MKTIMTTTGFSNTTMKTIMTTTGFSNTTQFSNTTLASVSGSEQDPSVSDDNTALIGGIVGGVTALLLIIGLITFIVARKRRGRARAAASRKDDVSMAPAQASSRSSDYAKINFKPSEYDQFFVKNSTAAKTNDVDLSDSNYEKSNIVI